MWLDFGSEELKYCLAFALFFVFHHHQSSLACFVFVVDIRHFLFILKLKPNNYLKTKKNPVT